MLLDTLHQMNKALTVPATLQTPRLGSLIKQGVLHALVKYLDGAQLTNELVGARTQLPDPEEEDRSEIPPWEDPDQSNSEADSQPLEPTRRPRRTLLDFFRPSN